MLTVLVALLAVIIGVLFYRRTFKEGRELEVLHIQGQLAQLARQRDCMKSDERVSVRSALRFSGPEGNP